MDAPADSLFALMRWDEALGPGAVLFHRFAEECAAALMAEIHAIATAAPFRHLTTPGGRTMFAAMTCSGVVGWTSDAQGYRYADLDPLSGRPWPAMPPTAVALAGLAASAAGYTGFAPNVCLLNRYAVGARMGLHQDRDEGDLTAPVVSFSLGLPANFFFGGTVRGGKTPRFRLEHGDVAVWGGPTRLAFHGIAPIAAGTHPLTGALRYNLTVRQVRH